MHPYTQALIASVPDIEGEKMIKGIPGMAPSPLEWPSGCRFHPRCPRVMDICKDVEPELAEISKGRCVACHLYKGG